MFNPEFLNVNGLQGKAESANGLPYKIVYFLHFNVKGLIPELFVLFPYFQRILQLYRVAPLE